MAFNLESNISSYKSHSSSSIFKRDHVTRVLYFSGCELQLIFFNIHLSNIHTTFESYTYKLTKISRRPLQGRLGLGDLIIFKWQNIYHFQWWWYLAISQSRISFFPLLLQNDYSFFVWHNHSREQTKLILCFWQAVHHKRVVNCWFSTVIKIQIRQVNWFGHNKQIVNDEQGTILREILHEN